MNLSAVKVIGRDVELKISANGIALEGDWTELGFDNLTGILAKEPLKQPLITYSENSSVLQPLRLVENKEYDFTIRIKSSETELIDSLESRAMSPFQMDSLLGVATLNSRDSWKSTGEWLTITGRLNYRNRAGLSNLSIIHGTSKLDLIIDVAPAKFNYEEHFHTMLDALAKRHTELLLRLDTGVETGLDILDEEPNSPMLEMIHLRRLFESGILDQAVRLIELNSTRSVKLERLYEPTPLCTDPDWDRFLTSPFESDWARSGSRRGFSNGWIPVNLPTAQKHITNESKENCYVKHLLSMLSSRLEELDRLLPKEKTASHFALQRWQSSLQNILSSPFWIGISILGAMPNSMALLQRAGYRDILRAMAELAMAVKYSATYLLSETSGEIKPVYDLYELWCFFEFCDVVSKISGTEICEQVSLGTDPGDPISLAEATSRMPLKATFDCRGKTVKFTIYYNRNFVRTDENEWQDSYSVRLRPDISLFVESGDINHWLHFDAKYRLDVRHLIDAWGNEFKENKTASSFVEQDIKAMHTYRDALLGTRGSYILFPGREEKPRLFIRHGLETYRNSSTVPGVGAFSLLPSPTINNQKASLTNFLTDAVEQISQSTKYDEETGLS